MITENLSTLKIHKLTQEQYDRELAAGRIDETALYLTPDEDVDLSPYATVEQLNSKADTEHSHDDSYYTETEIDIKLEEINSTIEGKANSTHSHKIGDIDTLSEKLDEKVSTNRTINGKSLATNIVLSASDIGAATSEHSHNDSYYTESEVDNLLLGKASTSHIHDDIYYTETEIDETIDNLSSEIKEDTINKINTHNTSISTHNDIRVLISDLTTKLNNFLDVDDKTTDQLSEIITMINNNKGTLDSLTITKVNVSDIIDNLTTNTSNKVLSAAQGVVIKNLIDTLQQELNSHTHTVSDITDLTATATELNYMDGVTSNVQTQLDSKANVDSTVDLTSTQTVSGVKTFSNGIVIGNVTITHDTTNNRLVINIP